MTTKQKQHLLAYLGYYTAPVDGIWGPDSITATKNFQWEYGLDADGVFGDDTRDKIFEVITKPAAQKPPGPSPTPEPSEDWWDEIEYFDRSEFKCKCGRYCNGYPVEMDPVIVRVCDRVRKHFNSPATPISGIRCPVHNKNVGGVYNSRHLEGKAVDLYVSGVSQTKLLAYVLKQPEIDYAYAITGSQNVHLDRK